MIIQKLFFAALAVSTAVSANSLETIPFRAILSSANESPAIAGLNATGVGTIWLHIERDNTGKIVSAVTEFSADYKFPGEVTFTGMHIHKGTAGGNGPVTINSGLNTATAVTSTTGTGNISLQGTTAATDAAGLDTVNGMLADPSGFYLNLHTTVNPGGAIRGQLQRAEMVVLLGAMSPANEVPPIDSTASAVGSIVALITRDNNGNATSGRVTFDANYSGFTEGVDITGFHIHKGAAGGSGPVIINTGINGTTGAVAVGAGGAGNLHYDVEVDVTNAAQLDALNGLFSHPQDYYENIHTRTNPGGLVRSQLRTTDKMVFPLEMTSDKEVPALATSQGTGTGALTVHTIRDASGKVIGGVTFFDVKTAFTGAATVTGMHIHNGKTTESGGVTINTGINTANGPVFATGVGSLYRMVTVSNATGLSTLNSLVANPENHYVNVHTTVNPGGAIRAQVAAPNAQMPAISATISAISDPSRRTVAPGGLATIFGSNMVKIASSPTASTPGTTMPTEFNGTSVTIGGKAAPIMMMDWSFLVVQVPVDTPAGSQSVVVTNSNGAGTASNVEVAPVAPGIFFDANGGLILKNSDYTIVGTNNAAKAGDILLIYSTGLGSTTPALATGQLTPAPGANNTLYHTATPKVTIGGKDAQVIYSIASPGFLGLYQTAVVVPAGAGTGKVPVVVSMNGVASNTVNTDLQ